MFVAQAEYQDSVWKLKKALYGFKKSPIAWFWNISEVAMDFDLHHCQTDHFILQLHPNVEYILFVVYENDIIIIGNNIEGITRFKQFLQQYFETKYHVLQLPPWGV